MPKVFQLNYDYENSFEVEKELISSSEKGDLIFSYIISYI